MYSKILKNIIYPIYQIRLPKEERFIPYLKFLKKTQWWEYSDLEKLQLKKLKLLLNHAYTNVPYYNKLFKECNFRPNDLTNINELKRLPILTKKTVRNNFDYLYPRNYSTKNLIPYATSGSTGTPMKFFINNKSQNYNMAAAYRAWSWAGFELGEKMAYLEGAPQDFLNQNKFKNNIINLTLRIIKLNSYELTQENIQNYINTLRTYEPKVINSFASAIYILAKYMEKKGIDDIRPKAILTTADMLFDHYRKTIERVFGCDVFDYYSGRDTTMHASECSEHSGYHLSMENAVVEFIKENESAAFGEAGKIIITDLCNYAMPFIRYEIGDIGVPTDEICPCGRKLPLMKSLKGRIVDTVVTPEGKILNGEFFPAIFDNYHLKGFEEFQIIQTRKDKLIIKLVKGEDYTDSDLDLYLNIIKKCVGNKMKIEVQFVNKIEPTISGKHRIVISEIKE